MTAIISDRNKPLSWVCVIQRSHSWTSPEEWLNQNAWVSTHEPYCLAAQLAYCEKEHIPFILYPSYQEAIEDFISSTEGSNPGGEFLTLKNINVIDSNKVEAVLEGYPADKWSVKKGSCFHRLILLGLPKKNFNSYHEILERL